MEVVVKLLRAWLLGLLVALATLDATAAALFNSTGSSHGFGDVIGPYLLAKQFESFDQKVYFLVDDRAESVLRTYLELGDRALPSVPSFVFVRAADLPRMKDVDAIFETFEGARRSSGLVVNAAALLLKGPEVVITVQDLHSPFGREYLPPELLADGLSEARTSKRRVFFSAAGLGRTRLGILRDEDVDAVVGKSAAERRERAAESLAPNSALHSLLTDGGLDAPLLTFAYGLHNEVFATKEWKPYPGQFRSYVKGLRQIARSHRRGVVVVTPNKADIVRQTLAEADAAVLEHVQVLDEKEASLAPVEGGEVRIVCVGPLSHRQFLAMTATADLPYLIEGDSALSAAVQLGRPFVMMKGPWGLFGIDGLSRALTEAGASWASRVYPIHDVPGHDTPDFSALGEIAADEASFTRLRANAQDFARSLKAVVDLMTERRSAESVLAELQDPVLRASWSGNSSVIQQRIFEAKIHVTSPRCSAAFD